MKRIIPVCHYIKPCPLKKVENGITYCSKPNDHECSHRQFKKRITMAIAEDFLVSTDLTDEEIDDIIKEKANGADYLWTDNLDNLFD